jgi:hypothetical protein
MLPVHFCNYNLDYQQRLGFLKLLAWMAPGVRGGKEELLRKIKSLYPPSAASRKITSRQRDCATQPAQRVSEAHHLKGVFDPNTLLQLDEIPSWQQGFSFQRLDRLLLWGQMLGLITENGRLAEWSRPLVADQGVSVFRRGSFPNPFILSRREKAFFLALLMFHDHVLLYITSILSRFDSGTYIDARRACIEVMDALGRTLDGASGTNIQSVRARQALRNLLERLAGMEKLSHKGALLNPEERRRVLEQIADKKIRNHLAEYHAVCRFEQLTDLGLLVKSRVDHAPETQDDRYRDRITWGWYTTDALKSAGKLINANGDDVETYLQKHWAQSALAQNISTRVLEAGHDQLEIAELLDNALPRATRQLGAIQVHTWVFIAALDAIDAGKALEFSTAYSLLDAMRQDSRYSNYLRQSGQQTYLGRTASIIEGSMSDYLSRFPMEYER